MHTPLPLYQTMCHKQRKGRKLTNDMAWVIRANPDKPARLLGEIFKVTTRQIEHVRYGHSFKHIEPPNELWV